MVLTHPRLTTLQIFYKINICFQIYIIIPITGEKEHSKTLGLKNSLNNLRLIIPKSLKEKYQFSSRPQTDKVGYHYFNF